MLPVFIPKHGVNNLCMEKLRGSVSFLRIWCKWEENERVKLIEIYFIVMYIA
jgi:hypothetical protein